MVITVFDVQHGFCALVEADNGNALLVDCGHSVKSGFRPSRFLGASGCNRIEGLILTHFDEDHASDLPNLRRRFKIDAFLYNPTIPETHIIKTKQEAGGVGNGTREAISMMTTYANDQSEVSSAMGAEIHLFYNSYPSFQDLNDLSLVTFLHYKDIHIIFPGDLQEAGWKALLRRREFQEELERTKIFVASHHGRANGYCAEVFSYCHPEVVIISDKQIVHETQCIDYGKHASGINCGSDKDPRKVLTTRKDGRIYIYQRPGKQVSIVPYSDSGGLLA